MKIEQDMIVLLGILATCLHILGVLSAIHAVMKAKTSQGAIAWTLSLITFPYLTLPLYWIFGQDKFMGYVIARQDQDLRLGTLRALVKPPSVELLKALPIESSTVKVLEGLADLPFTLGNKAKLLINGDETFGAIFEGIASAKEYILVQFFIVHDDELGKELKQKLIEAAKRGVKIYFMFDSVGTHALPKKYIQELEAANITVFSFKTTKGIKTRFQLNFRNHRKIVVVDGNVAFVGGLNVGDEYMGKSKFGFWRDTHVRVEGPAAMHAQLSFSEDWFWSSGKVPELKWNMNSSLTDGKAVLVLPTGPADGLDSCSLFFQEAIHAAKKRIWITSPYFVPDQAVISALQLAAMRGVDVRIILPNQADHFLVYWASFSYLKDTLPFNIKLYRYQKGFIHQKALLVDDGLSSVGTANFDNRSFKLNFEITMVFADIEFSKTVEAMLLEDFSHCKKVEISEITERSYAFKVIVQVSRLMSPIL